MVVLPRLDRQSAYDMLERLLSPDLSAVRSTMPDTSPVVTYPPTGGTRISDQQLRDLRTAMVELADTFGMPDPLVRTQEFEGRGARLLHEMLPMTPHEAAHEEVWSYLTCCWLLDIAVWRFGHDADRRRFIGDINRNTFRRMWWRSEILGDEVDLTLLGEDELVSITERPTIAADRRLARAVAREFLARVDRGAADSRMRLMRESMKRLLRLTPFIALPALSDDALHLVIEDCFNAAAAGISGDATSGGGRHRLPRGDLASTSELLPEPSPDVSVISRMTIAGVAGETAAPAELHAAKDFETVARVALDIARRAGRVTNEGLRSIVSVTSDEAREVFRALIRNGSLVQRGVKLGTHYVIPEHLDASNDEATALPNPTRSDSDGPAAGKVPDPVAPDRSNSVALRRMLQEGR